MMKATAVTLTSVFRNVFPRNSESPRFDKYRKFAGFIWYMANSAGAIGQVLDLLIPY